MSRAQRKPPEQHEHERWQKPGWRSTVNIGDYVRAPPDLPGRSGWVTEVTETPGQPDLVMIKSRTNAGTALRVNHLTWSATEHIWLWGA